MVSDSFCAAVESIPVYLTLTPINGYTFGKKAFYDWADGLLCDEFFKAEDEQAMDSVRWIKHLLSLVVLCTNSERARNFIRCN